MSTQKERKAMFGTTPESFRRRVASALPGAQEVKPMNRRTTLRTALIVALTLALLTAAAYAIGTRGGLIDYLSSRYNMTVPDAARELLETTSPRVIDLAGARFSLNEAVADGHILYTTTNIRAANGAQAVMYWSSDGPPDTPMQPDARAAYGSESEESYLDAARRLNVPLLGVRVNPEVTDENFSGTEMMDAMWLEDGSLTLINMLVLETDATSIPVSFRVTAQAFDPQTGTALADVTRSELSLVVPVTGALTTARFSGEDANAIADADAGLPPLPYKVVGAEAETTPLGTYISIRVRAEDGQAKSEHGWIFQARLLDATGAELPYGMNLSSGWNDSAWPEIVIHKMTSAVGPFDALTLELVPTNYEEDPATSPYAARTVTLLPAEETGASDGRKPSDGAHRGHRR